MSKTLEGFEFEDKTNRFCWIPVHCGVWGNEQADLLAKNFANLLQHTNSETSVWKIKQFLKNLCKTNSLQDVRTRSALKCWKRVSPSSIPDKSRRALVAAFRLSTGHHRLSAHLHLQGHSATLFCPLCKTGTKWARTINSDVGPQWTH
ncbi:uncharacterized protein [Parasteatoda tepidariorum]|uniref:uncharacterized protein n=1 Tax=Parasteatoda tepidariorum TaxID=114398 RepID=UPI0039BCAE43